MGCIVHEVTESDMTEWLSLSLSGPYSSSLGGGGKIYKIYQIYVYQMYLYMYIYIYNVCVYMYKIYQSWLHADPYPYQPKQCSIYTMKYEDCHCKTTR